MNETHNLTEGSPYSTTIVRTEEEVADQIHEINLMLSEVDEIPVRVQTTHDAQDRAFGQGALLMYEWLTGQTEEPLIAMDEAFEG